MAAGGGAWSDATLTNALTGADRAIAGASAQLLIQHALTGAKPVLARADNGKNYWLKWPGNPHGNMSLVHEVVVARLGRLIGAPVRPMCLVSVADALVDDYYIDGSRLPAGLYFGSEVLTDVEEHTAIVRTGSDGNASRFAYYLALWDLCLGTDLQLLYDVGQQDQVWSIDHGLWFDSLESDWSPELLQRRVGQPWDWPATPLPRGLDRAAFSGAADAIDALTAVDLADVMADVPLEWGVSDNALRDLALFVHTRRPAVAKRLRESARRP